VTLGSLISGARLRAKKTQGKVAAALRSLCSEDEPSCGLSASFLNEVEHDRRALDQTYWSSLVKELPELTLEKLAEAAVATHALSVDARGLSEDVREALARVVVAAVHERVERSEST
jgi:hypothetical protein